MKKWKLFWFIPATLIVSLSIPYVIAFLVGKLPSCLSDLLDTEKYIPMATSIFTFLATITLSLSVYDSNKKKERQESKKTFNEERADAFEFFWFLKGALDDIEALCGNGLRPFSVEEKREDYIKIAYRFGLSNEQIETLRTVLFDIRAIAKKKDDNERRPKCKDFNDQTDRIALCRSIIDYLSDKYEFRNDL